MKMLEVFKREGAFPEDKDLQWVLDFVYQHRIYLYDALNERFSRDTLKAIEFFLQTDEMYDGDESAAWERFLNTDIEFLLNL